MNEVKHIQKLCGNRTPFTVPEGYFDNLTQRVMANIPTEETKIVNINNGREKSHWKQWTALVAACMAGALVCVNIANHTTSESTTSQLLSNATAQTQTYDEQQQYNQEVLDYAMVDQNDIYNYLSGSEY